MFIGMTEDTMSLISRTTFYIRHVMLLSALVGLFASVYLLIVYITGGPIVCVVSGGCETVRASKWAYPLGIPTPLFGVLFYVGMILLMGWRVFMPHVYPERIRQSLFLGSAVGLAISLFLTGVEAFDLDAYCTWCVVSALSAAALFLSTLFDRRALVSTDISLQEMQWFFGMLALSVVLGGGALFFLLFR